MPEAPRIAHRVEAVRAPVAIRVRDARDLRRVRGVERAVAPRQPEHFIQPARKRAHARSRTLIAHAAEQQNLPAPRPHREPPIRQRNKTPRFHIHALRHRHIDEPVISRLPLRRAPSVAEVLRYSGVRLEANTKESSSQSGSTLAPERQRRSIFQPRVGAKRLPWVSGKNPPQP